MSAPNYVRWFNEIRLEDVPVVGGKNASLGELYSILSSEGVRVPNGFALTAQSYRDALTAAWTKLHALLDGAGLGIDPISVNPASLMRTMTVVREAEDLEQRR